MPRFWAPLRTSLLLLAVGAPAWAGNHERKTIESSIEVVRAFSAIPLKGIPRAMLHRAVGVAIIPHVIKAGLVIDVRAGHGVVLVHEPDGCWSNPVFVSLKGGGVGGQAGIEATDLVLVFKSRKVVERALRGKLTLGGDVTVAAGPVGREAESGADGLWKAEVCTYSRSRGLFVGVSLEGARLQVEGRANEGFYGVHGGRPPDVLARRGAPIAAVEALKAELMRLSTPPVPPGAVVVPVAPPGPYLPPMPVPVPRPR